MNSFTQADNHYQARVRNILQLLQQRRVDDAVSACLALTRSNPESNDALLLLGKARQMQGRFEDMLQLVRTALEREPQNLGLQLQFAGACQSCGHHDQALAQIAETEKLVQKDAALLQQLAQLYVHAGRFQEAHECYARAVELDGNNPLYLKNLASSFVAMGELRQAEDTYSKVIWRDAANYEAWYNRSTLRRQTEEDNHVQALEKRLRQLSADDAGKASLCYALAKECEDLGQYKRSFSYLKRGARDLDRRMPYNVQTDLSIMQRITELFDQSWVASAEDAVARRGPIFVLGLPRSGTTLVDRIASSHSEVQSMGEIPDFARTMTLLSDSAGRSQLLEASARIKPDELGKRYVQSVVSYGVDRPFFIDKTPTNYLYVGLIATALPGASIIHVRRHPVDSCLSMYRALFRTGYPFSYSLDNLAEYYIGYDALMQHWHKVFPGRVLDVSYEELISDQERVSRDVIDHCGLEWEEACLEFDRNKAPVATASAAQVRKPIYRDAVARWRHFEKQLAPLVNRLQEAGIAL